LTSFVWPHHLERHERLRGALQVAAQHPVTVDRAGAAAWLREQLSVAALPDVLTVVWHSVTRLYWPAPEVIAVEGILAAAGERMPLAEVSMEYPHTESGAGAELRVILRCPGHASTEVLLATVEDHGIPVRID
jgi:hypothetical protein